MARIVKRGGDLVWVNGDGASTYYIGQIVSYTPATKTNEMDGNVIPLAVPAGAADATNMQIPAGIVVGFDLRTPKTVVAVGSQYLQNDGGTMVSQAAQLARDWTGVEGMHGKGDPAIFLQIEEILPDTLIQMPICNAALGTAPTVATATVVSSSTDGMITAITNNAIDHTNVALMGTVYCRSGANAGIYRVQKSTTTTALSVTQAFPYDPAVGDTFVSVPFKQGNSTIYIAGPGLYVDCSKNPVIAATNLFHVIVQRMDLSTAGREYVNFRFGGDHFCRFRA